MINNLIYSSPLPLQCWLRRVNSALCIGELLIIEHNFLDSIANIVQGGGDFAYFIDFL
jgi:hypothetical protein